MLCTFQGLHLKLAVRFLAANSDAVHIVSAQYILNIAEGKLGWRCHKYNWKCTFRSFPFLRYFLILFLQLILICVPEHPSSMSSFVSDLLFSCSQLSRANIPNPGLFLFLVLIIWLWILDLVMVNKYWQPCVPYQINGNLTLRANIQFNINTVCHANVSFKIIMTKIKHQ